MKHSVKRFILSSCLLLLALAPLSRGQGGSEVSPNAIPEAMTTDLKFTVNRLVTGGNLREAVPYLEELIRRFGQTKVAQYDRELERYYYFLGAAWIQSEEYEFAVEALEKYAQRFPKANDAPIVLDWLGDCYRLTEDFRKAATVYENLRAQYALKGAMLDEVMSKEAICLVQLEEWEKVIPLLTQLLEQARDPELRGMAATTLVRAYLSLDQVDKIVQLLPQVMAISQARYDVDFNLMLIRGGDTKYHASDYPNALMLYQLALTKEELLVRLEELIGRTERAIQAWKDFQNIRGFTALKTRLKSLQSQREDLLRRDSFTEELLFRMGQTYFEMNRKWEAFWTFWSIWKTLPESKDARQALFSSFQLAAELNMDSRAIEFGQTFLDTFGLGDYFDEVSLQLANLQLRNRNYDAAIKVVEQALAANPDHAFKDRLIFITGYCLFQKDQLTEALAAFTEIRTHHPDSEAEEGANYWIGLTYLFLQQYEDARDEFSEFVNRYVSGIYYEDARFRLGVAEYGLGEFVAARGHFEKFIADFPSSPLLAEAYSFLGDIAGSDARLSEALELYAQVPKHTSRMNQIDHAAFQTGKILELQGKFGELADYFTRYIQTYRNKGQFTEAIYRIGFARKMQGDFSGMLSAYEQAVRRYADDASALGVDLILKDWVDQSIQTEGRPPEAKLREWLDNVKAQKTKTAWLRYQWALSDLAKLDPAPEFTPELLEFATPAVLEWMGRTTAARNPTLARKAFEKSVKEFPDSLWAGDCILEWAELEAASDQYAKAQALFDRYMTSFPTAEKAGAALKRSADMLVALKKYPEAVENYLRILEMKEWRGPLWPESLYQIGFALMEQGKLQEAFGYFQRVYVMYGGYPEWCARAYLQSGIALEKLNRRREAVATYEEMLTHENLRALEWGREAEKRLAALR
ncbi:MAG: tetratricopeptide repeat protein [Kiritimatiellae bacterium]|nr:tetratricopeptide repeat protein [Kiritimatiellia bacterium]